jgi:hypothetical protein
MINEKKGDKENEMVKLEVLENEIKIIIKKSSQGKIRFKRFNQYGKTLQKTFIDVNSQEQFIEWLITYNIDIKNKNKISNSDLVVSQCIYTDLKNNKKHPYELPKFLCEMKKKQWVTDKDLQELIDEILSYDSYLDNIPIEIKNTNEKFKLGNLEFEVKKIIVPIFSLYNNDKTFIEAVKEKQQRGHSMQIRVYFCLPLFGSNFIIQNQHNPEEIVYRLTNENKASIMKLFRVFGCASKNHQHDILETLKCIKNTCSDK